MSSARATHDGAFMEPRGCNRRQSAANQSAARTAGTSQMVRRGSTVRVRQRASGFFVLRCWFRFRGQRRIPDSTSTQRPPTSTACSGTCGRSQAAGRGCPARTRHRDARLSPTDKLALHVGLWYPRARVKLIPTASPVKPRRLDGRCDADAARLRTLRPLLHLVLDLRALGEALVALALDRAVVDEHVLARVIRRDEAVALVVAEPLHGSGCHLDTSLDCFTNVQRKAQAKTRESSTSSRGSAGTRSHSPVVADDTSSRRTAHRAEIFTVSELRFAWKTRHSQA